MTLEVSQASTTLVCVMNVDYHQFINRNLPLVERGCTSKALFLSRGEARAWVRSGRRSDGRLDPYHCRYCGGWHVGHRRGHSGPVRHTLGN